MGHRIDPIENLCSIVNRKLYEGGKQYRSKADIWEAKSNICAEVSPDDIGKLTNYIDHRLVKVIERKGHACTGRHAYKYLLLCYLC